MRHPESEPSRNAVLINAKGVEAAQCEFILRAATLDAAEARMNAIEMINLLLEEECFPQFTAVRRSG